MNTAASKELVQPQADRTAEPVVRVSDLHKHYETDGEVVTVTADINHLTSFVVVDDGAWVVTLRPDPVSVPADGSGQVDVDLVSKRGRGAVRR